MDNKTLEALLDLLDLMAGVIGIDVDNIIKTLEQKVASDPAISQALLTLVQRTYVILSPYIDADRMGELVLESKLDPDYFDEHIAEH